MSCWTARADKAGNSLLEALSTGAGPEGMLLERGLFGVVEPDGPELQRLVTGPAAASGAHRRRLIQAFGKERAAASWSQ